MVFTLFLTGDNAQQEWASTHGLTHPVVDDSNYDVTGRFVSGSFGIPNVQVLSPGMKVEITNINSITAAQIEEWLPR